MHFFRRLPLRRLRVLRPLRPRTRLLLLTLLLILALYLHFGWLPTVRELVIMEADNETSDLINEAVDAYVAQGQIRYDDLVTLERRADGGVSAARIDLAAVNQMKSTVLRELDERVPIRVRGRKGRRTRSRRRGSLLKKCMIPPPDSLCRRTKVYARDLPLDDPAGFPGFSIAHSGWKFHSFFGNPVGNGKEAPPVFLPGRPAEPTDFRNAAHRSGAGGFFGSIPFSAL